MSLAKIEALAIAADFFVIPKFYGFPIIYLEALACGTPVVITNAGDYINDFNEKI
jgi:glycosyltransferase involved in cell wall biosynthesis